MRKLPEGWFEKELGEVVTFQRGFDLPKKDRANGDFLLMVSNGQDGTHKDYKVKAPGIVTGRSGTLGKVFYLKEDFWPLNTTLWIKDFHGNNTKFTYYFLKKFPFEKYNSGSGVPTLNRNHIHPLPVMVPPLPEQKAIAAMLSSFDDKIELLREQNKTLETLAQTIFKAWFVHFNFPNEQGKPYRDSGGEMVDSELGEIPKGWEGGSLLEVFDLIGGGTPKTSVDEYWNGGIPWYSVVDAPKGSETFVIETEKQISPLGLSKSSTKLLQKGTTIVSARGTVGKLALVGRETAMNQSCYGVKGKGCFGDYYVYFQLKEALNSLKSRVHGAVFDTITQSTFKNIMVSLPDHEVVVGYEERVTPIMKKILNNVLQVQSLSKTRDALLPKLMSGQVRVKGVHDDG